MRLIDADRLKRQVEGRSWRAKEKFIELIDNAPTIEAEPVKHGRWEWIGGYGYQYRCSECIMCAERRTKYCPNCGAKMDAEEGEEA